MLEEENWIWQEPAFEVLTAKTDSGRRQLDRLVDPTVISIRAIEQEESDSNHDGFATNSLALGRMTL